MLFPYLLFPIVVQILLPSISCEQNLHHKVSSSNGNEETNKTSKVRRNDATDENPEGNYGNYSTKVQFKEDGGTKETSDDNDIDEYDEKYDDDIDSSKENYISSAEYSGNQNSDEEMVKMSGNYYENDVDYSNDDNDSYDNGDEENLSSDDNKLKLSVKHSENYVEDSSEKNNTSSTAGQVKQSSGEDVTERQWKYFEIDVKESNKNGNKYEEINTIEEEPSGIISENDGEDNSGKSQASSAVDEGNQNSDDDVPKSSQNDKENSSNKNYASSAVDEEKQNSDEVISESLQIDEGNSSDKNYASSAVDQGNEINDKDAAKNSDNDLGDSNDKNESTGAKNAGGSAVLSGNNGYADSEAKANTPQSHENDESDSKENSTHVPGDKLSGHNNDLPSDYDQVNEKVNFEELSKECPTECPADETMVCSRCKHQIYRTFLSVCHMRMYACKHPEDRLELVSRQACLLSAPVSDSFPSPRGRLAEPTDSVFRYLHCKSKNMRGKDCKFTDGR